MCPIMKLTVTVGKEYHKYLNVSHHEAYGNCR